MASPLATCQGVGYLCTPGIPTDKRGQFGPVASGACAQVRRHGRIARHQDCSLVLRFLGRRDRQENDCQRAVGRESVRLAARSRRTRAGRAGPAEACWPGRRGSEPPDAGHSGPGRTGFESCRARYRGAVPRRRGMGEAAAAVRSGSRGRGNGAKERPPRNRDNGHPLPVLRSQNLPGAIEHNREVGSRYKARLSRQLA